MTRTVTCSATRLGNSISQVAASAQSMAYCVGSLGTLASMRNAPTGAWLNRTTRPLWQPMRVHAANGLQPASTAVAVKRKERRRMADRGSGRWISIGAPLERAGPPGGDTRGHEGNVTTCDHD